MTSEQAKILIIDNNDNYIKRIKRLFSEPNVAVRKRSNVNGLLKELETDSYNLLFLVGSVVNGQDSRAIELLQEISQISPSTQVFILVDPKEISFALSALKIGDFRYAKQPVSDDELRLLIETTLNHQPNIVNEGTSHSLDSGGSRLWRLVGRSEPMQQVYRYIRQAAAIEIPVLLLGETGTGKDLIAHAIHHLSNHKKGPYVPVNLGAMPTELVATELFGHQKGAFTGATEQHEGIFEQGNGGTVFLDEIEAMDQKTQVSLLRFLEQKEYRRVGGNQIKSSSCRIVASSNGDLEALVKQGSFRKDLFYRLDVFRIEVPPLREREGDVPLLIEEYLSRYNHAYKKNIRGIDQECIQILENYHWPGNVRELKNVIQRAVIVCEGDTLYLDHLPPRFRSLPPSKQTISFDLGTPLDVIERQALLKALSQTNNNRKEAAKLLGISRRAIYNKLEKHHIK